MVAKADEIDRILGRMRAELIKALQEEQGGAKEDE